MVYKWCVVPQCTNTSISRPDKMFVSVPTKPKRREMWLQLAGRDPKSILSHTNVFMCEDHFDMENDTINYMQYKSGFSQKILLADEAAPTKFHCQEDRKRQLPDAESFQEVFLKRQRMDLVTETHAENLQKDNNMKQEIIEPEDLPKTQDNETITDSFISISATETHAESLQKDNNMKQEIIEPEDLPKTRDKETHAESLQKDNNIKQEIIEPEDLPKTQDKETITDPIISISATYAESLQKDNNIKQEIIDPEELPKTQDNETITDPIITNCANCGYRVIHNFLEL